jgi:hypothetical protein
LAAPCIQRRFEATNIVRASKKGASDFTRAFRPAYGLAPQDIRQYRTDMHARHNRL